MLGVGGWEVPMMLVACSPIFVVVSFGKISHMLIGVLGNLLTQGREKVVKCKSHSPRAKWDVSLAIPGTGLSSMYYVYVQPKHRSIIRVLDLGYNCKKQLSGNSV